LTIGSDGFLVICSPLAANYVFSGYPNNTCDRTASTGGPADSNGDDQIAIVSGVPGGSISVLDIYGVPGQQGSATVGHFFQYGRAERVPGRLSPKSVWNASDWISVYGNSTAGFGSNAMDMTPRKWSRTLNPTSKPSVILTGNPAIVTTLNPRSTPSVAPTVFVNEDSKPSARPSFQQSSNYITFKPSEHTTTKPSTKQSTKPTSTPSSAPTANTTSMPNLIITELADPKDKSGARYVELYSLYGSGQTINNSTLYLLRWNNANAGKNAQ
jgi:hypothetical protein